MTTNKPTHECPVLAGGNDVPIWALAPAAVALFVAWLVSMCYACVAQLLLDHTGSGFVACVGATTIIAGIPVYIVMHYVWR